MRIVVDTNVIASAIFFGGKPYQLLHHTFFVDCFIVKVLVTAITMYLASKFRNRDSGESNR